MDYKELFSDDDIIVTKRQYYINKNGVANSRALAEYVKDISVLLEKYIIYIGIDLSEVNKKGRSLGDYTLNKLLVSLKFSHIFHLYGGKYVVLCEEALKDRVISILTRKRDGCMCYYSVQELDKEKDFYEQLSVGYDLMVEDKSNKQLESIASGKNKGNIPEQFMETETTKYMNTCWYNEYLILPKGQFKDAKVTVYPMEFSRDKIKLLAIVSDEQKQRAFIGTELRFGYKGTLFSVTGRFSRDKNLDVVIYSTNGESEITTREIEGIGIPENFGKRLERGELFPFKTIMGTNGFVYVEGDKATIYETNLVEINGNMYHISWDSAELVVTKE